MRLTFTCVYFAGNLKLAAVGGVNTAALSNVKVGVGVGHTAGTKLYTN